MKKSDFIHDLFYAARDKGVALALARPVFEDVRQRDIDLLIEHKNLPFLQDFLTQNKSLKRTCRVLRADGETLHVYGIENEGSLALPIDAVTSLSFKGISYADIRHVLQRAETDENGVRTLDKVDQALILLITHGVKHKGPLKQRYIDTVQAAMKDSPVAFDEVVTTLFGDQAGLDLIDAIRANDLPPQLWKRLARRYVRHAWDRRGPLTVVDRISYYVTRVITAFVSPRYNVAVYGLDGSGKTTLIDNLQKTLNLATTGIRCPHFLPSLPWRDEADSEVALSTPHAKPKRGAFTSVVKLIYLLFRYWLAYLWPRQEAVLFLYDRSLPDIFADPVRYRYGGPIEVLKWACRLAPPVTASILVDVDAETAHSRKKEVSLAEARRQSEAYRALIGSLPNPIVLKGEMPADRLTAITTAHIVNALTKRTEAK